MNLFYLKSLFEYDKSHLKRTENIEQIALTFNKLQERINTFSDIFLFRNFWKLEIKHYNQLYFRNRIRKRFLIRLAYAVGLVHTSYKCANCAQVFVNEENKRGNKLWLIQILPRTVFSSFVMRNTHIKMRLPFEWVTEWNALGASNMIQQFENVECIKRHVRRPV